MGMRRSSVTSLQTRPRVLPWPAAWRESSARPPPSLPDHAGICNATCTGTAMNVGQKGVPKKTRPTTSSANPGFAARPYVVRPIHPCRFAFLNHVVAACNPSDCKPPTTTVELVSRETELESTRKLRIFFAVWPLRRRREELSQWRLAAVTGIAGAHRQLQQALRVHPQCGQRREGCPAPRQRGPPQPHLPTGRGPGRERERAFGAAPTLGCRSARQPRARRPPTGNVPALLAGAPGRCGACALGPAEAPALASHRHRVMRYRRAGWG